MRFKKKSQLLYSAANPAQPEQIAGIKPSFNNFIMIPLKIDLIVIWDFQDPYIVRF